MNPKFDLYNWFEGIDDHEPRRIKAVGEVFNRPILMGRTLEGKTLYGSTLATFNSLDSEYNGCAFRSCLITESDFNTGTFRNCHFSDVKIIDSHIYRIKFEGCTFADTEITLSSSIEGDMELVFDNCIFLNTLENWGSRILKESQFVNCTFVDESACPVYTVCSKN